MPKWEDQFIFGCAGWWYVSIGDIQGGYFYKLDSARAYVRRAAHGR